MPDRDRVAQRVVAMDEGVGECFTDGKLGKVLDLQPSLGDLRSGANAALRRTVDDGLP
jgi:hypothetical protein